MKRNPDSYRRVITEKQKAHLRAINTIHGHAATRHHGHTRTYQSWMSMKERCDDQRHKSYGSYGGRGIRYCEAWADFRGFLAYMGERPSGKTLGRIDHAGDYRPGNCRWETYKQQARNRSSSRWIEFRGETLTLTEWGERIGITEDALGHRLGAGWSIARTLTTPPKKQKNSKCCFKPQGQAELFQPTLQGG
jgi:hypothetical protein